jgi:bifunctional DNA-binding transcriptional regulator/antitoxin component of YhaV-PrlF toxin-antitoxin module
MEKLSVGAKMSDFVVADSEGRIMIPEKIRELLDIREGTCVLVANLAMCEVLFPIASPNAKLARLRADINDQPSSLARLSNAVAEANVNIQTVSMPPGIRGASSLIAILDFSRNNLDFNQLSEKLQNLGVFLKAGIKPI